MSVEYVIRKLINDKEQITTAEFMEEILSHKDFGYYTSKAPIGSEGDFITAPEISQLFGEMIGVWCASYWQHINKPQDMILVELGPGRGTLMQDLLRATRQVEGFHQAIPEIHLIEINPYLRQEQQTKLASYQGKIYWHKNMNDLPPKPMLLVANEFFDVLPVNQYIKDKHGWYEHMVSILPLTYELGFTRQQVSNQVSEMLELEYPEVSVGSIVELSPQRIDLIKKISDHIISYQGAALAIDYGYFEKKHHFMSTLQAIKNHQYHPVLEDLGAADITAHVDFAALKTAAEVRGVKTELHLQGQFLSSMGIEVRAKKLLAKATNSQMVNIVMGLNRLISPTQMGELFKVLELYS